MGCAEGDGACPASPSGDPGAPYLHLLHLVGHVVQAQVIGQRRGVQPVPVGQQQLGAPESLPAAAGRAALQRREVRHQPGAAVRGQRRRVLALPVRPSALLLAGRRRRRLVQGVDGEGVPEVRVGVAGLGVRQRLVRRGEVGGLEVGGARVRERRGRAVQVLADGGEVRQPRVPVAAPIVPVLESTQGWGTTGWPSAGSGDAAAARGCGWWHSVALGKERAEREPPCSCPGSLVVLRHFEDEITSLPGKKLQTSSRCSPHRNYTRPTLPLVRVIRRIIIIRKIQIRDAAAFPPRCLGWGGDAGAGGAAEPPPLERWGTPGTPIPPTPERCPGRGRGSARRGATAVLPPAVPSLLLPRFPISAVKAEMSTSS